MLSRIFDNLVLGRIVDRIGAFLDMIEEEIAPGQGQRIIDACCWGLWIGGGLMIVGTMLVPA